MAQLCVIKFKTMNKYQLAFCASGIILTATFCVHLQLYIAANNPTFILVSAVLYALLMFASGFVFGYKDHSAKEPQLGYRYHLLTFWVVNSTFFVTTVLSENVSRHFFSGMLFQFIAWGLGLLVHYLTLKSTLKNSI